MNAKPFSDNVDGKYKHFWKGEMLVCLLKLVK